MPYLNILMMKITRLKTMLMRMLVVMGK